MIKIDLRGFKLPITTQDNIYGKSSLYFINEPNSFSVSFGGGDDFAYGLIINGDVNPVFGITWNTINEWAVTELKLTRDEAYEVVETEAFDELVNEFSEFVLEQM